MLITDPDLSDLDDLEVADWCDQARADYCAAVLNNDHASWQQACTRSVLITSAEAQRRGIRAGSVH